MTTIQKNGYVFLVDREKTQQYYRTHTLCDCVYCRNYYAQVRQQFPRLDAFLSEFGVDIARPDEIMSVELERTRGVSQRGLYGLRKGSDDGRRGDRIV